MREESERKWAEYQREQKQYREEQQRKWDEQERKWNEQQSKWEANHRQNQEMLEHIKEQDKAIQEGFLVLTERLDRRLSAMGARWGISRERAFRDALAAILEESFGVQVLNINEYDDEGTVFGHPDQVELDVIIKNGLLILCELKSSMSKGDMYLFQRKADWYEHRHGRKATRRLVISPMIDHRARPVGERLGFELYTDSLEVE